MTYKYLIEKGKYLLTNEKFNFFDSLKQSIQIFVRILCRLVIFAFTFIITSMVFKHCIDIPIWNFTISLGAVIATLGSAVVSIFSLFCSEQYTQFNENEKILQNELIKINWDRWPFLKRKNKRKISKGVYEVKTLKNPHIIFCKSENSRKITIPLPTSKADFLELPIYSCFFMLMYNRQNLSLDNQDIEAALICDCLTSIYKHIVLYRIGQIFVWFGVCFIFNSIIFSFFYPSYMQFMNFIVM